jgi:hypothetical protein
MTTIGRHRVRVDAERPPKARRFYSRNYIKAQRTQQSDRPRQAGVTRGHRWSRHVTPCHLLSPAVTCCHLLSPAVTRCHPLSPAVTDGHGLSL